MSARRLRDWQSRLAALLAERRLQPFAWGTNDCCTFACDCVLATTGRDPAEGLRAHRSMEDAQKVLEAEGGVRALGDARLGVRIDPSLAAIGDVGLVRMDGSVPGLAVRAGDGWLAPASIGLVPIPLEAARVAWRCERG